MTSLLHGSHKNLKFVSIFGPGLGFTNYVTSSIEFQRARERRDLKFRGIVIVSCGSWELVAGIGAGSGSWRQGQIHSGDPICLC